MNRRIALVLVGLAILAAVVLLVLQRNGTGERYPVEAAGPPPGDDPELRGTAQPTPSRAGPHETVATPGGTDVAVVGGVRDGTTHRGLAGVRVMASCPGRAPWEGTTMEDGSFRLPFGARPHLPVDVLLRVLAPDARGADAVARIAPVGGDVVDVGTLLLRPTTTLVVRVVHAGNPVAGAIVHAASRPHRLGRGVGYQWGGRWRGYPYRATSDAAGLARLEHVPWGVVALLARGAGPLRGQRILDLEEAAASVELELLPARDLRVEVVWVHTGAPVPGCTVVPIAGVGQLEEPVRQAVTNEQGVVILKCLPDDVPIAVSVTGPPAYPVHWSDVSSAAVPGAPALRVELRSPATLRFPIVVEDGPFPPDGLRVALTRGSWGLERGMGAVVAPEGVVVDGELVLEVYRPSQERATARLPDGRVGAVWIRGEVDASGQPGDVRRPLEPVVFQAPRSLRVQVVERGTGAPAANVSVRMFLLSGPRELPPVRTNADGVVTFTGLPRARGWVSVCANPTWVPDARQGTLSQRIDVDLGEADAVVRFDVHASEEGVVRVTTAGRPGLPPGLHVDLWSRPEGGVWIRPNGFGYDPERSEVRYRGRRFVVEPTPPARAVDEPGSLLLRITSDTHATEYVRIEAGEALDAAVDLLPAASLLVQVVKPEGMSFHPALQIHERQGGWVHVPAQAAIAAQGGGKGDLYRSLRPGRYRLHDVGTGLVSHAVDVHVGLDADRLVWDVTNVGFAEGDIVLPPGVDPVGLSVFVMEGERQPRVISGARVTDGNHFRVQVPGDRPVWLRPVHGECIPDPEQEKVVFTGPRTGLHLRMVKIE